MIRQRSIGVAQEHHLTIEQLSAFLDRQLSPQEQAECDIHLQHCPQCQSSLAALLQTVSLLHALPQPELPRSFVLPARTLSIAERSERLVPSVAPITHSRSRSWQTYLQRSTRIISTIAAVLGILFIMSSLLTTLLSLPHGGAASTTSAPAFSPVQSLSPMPPSASSQSSNAAGQGQNPSSPVRNPRVTSTSDQAETNAPTPGQTAVNTIIPTPRSAPSNSNGQQGYAQTQSVSSILDLSMPEGRAGVGFILLILGVLGVFLTRRRSAKTCIP
jgi:anti-sigma factor RsiW